jgi:hypothetical protein
MICGHTQLHTFEIGPQSRGCLVLRVNVSLGLNHLLCICVFGSVVHVHVPAEKRK